MPKLQFEKSIDISASPREVFENIAHLGRWKSWNPWLVADPDAVVDVAPDGKSYHWAGKRTGEGRMSIAREVAEEEIDIDLQFLKPFKSQSRVSFHLQPLGEGCRVTWKMDGGLPFFLFFLKKMMTTMLGMDFERGLRMLKDDAEVGEVPSRLEWRGVSDYPGCSYVGIRTECAISDLGERMSKDFERLRAWAEETNAEVSASPFSVYNKWDFSRGICKYTSGYPVNVLPTSIPEGMMTGTLPSLRVYQIAHKGAYRHVGNAWSAGMQMAQSKEFAQDKSHPPFELYTTRPGEVAEGDQEVLVSFPVK
jgi:predicted transcriptional regulator YdeE